MCIRACVFGCVCASVCVCLGVCVCARVCLVFFLIMAKMENRTAKDFDVYYIPLQVRIESRFVGPINYESNTKTNRQNIL